MKFIEINATRTFYLKFKEKCENDMAAYLFGVVFIPANGQAKSAQQLKTTVLLFLPHIFLLVGFINYKQFD